MSKNEKVKKFIEMMVQREVKRLLPEAVRQVMSGMIMEASIDMSRSASPASLGNSHKRMAIQESTATDNWPMLGGRTLDSSRISDVMGYGDFTHPRTATGGGAITVDSAMTENGTPVAIDPSQIAPEVIQAMNRDYTELVRAWDRKRNG